MRSSATREALGSTPCQFWQPLLLQKTFPPRACLVGPRSGVGLLPRQTVALPHASAIALASRQEARPAMNPCFTRSGALRQEARQHTTLGCTRARKLCQERHAGPAENTTHNSLSRGIAQSGLGRAGPGAPHIRSAATTSTVCGATVTSYQCVRRDRGGAKLRLHATATHRVSSNVNLPGARALHEACPNLRCLSLHPWLTRGGRHG